MTLPNYKHYVNPKEPGQLCYVTTRCLDWAHLFMRDEMKSRMCLSLIRDCEKERAKLYAYVVMSDHIHFVAKPHETKTISSFVKSLQSQFSIENAQAFHLIGVKATGDAN